jgi:GNAT superfamily N-acetyltransferase
MVNWTTRQATAEDKEFLYVVNRAAYEDVVRKQFGQWDEAWQRQHFEETWTPETFEVVEKAGRRIGALSVSRTSEEVRIIEIQLLPEFQGKGIGTVLLQRELRFADERALPARLQVLRQNRARTLYERLGFRVCGETDTHFLMERTG